jgi:CBS domain-containing protein
MHVRQLLDTKPKNFIETVSEMQTLSDVVRRLAELKIGAVVVTDGDGGVTGIISERDIVRQLAAKGPSCLSSAVRDTMTKNVISAVPNDVAEDLLGKMTAGRFRHMPVIDDGTLIGILSIGDVVKAKMDSIKAENEALEGMIRGF